MRKEHLGRKELHLFYGGGKQVHGGGHQVSEEDAGVVVLSLFHGGTLNTDGNNLQPWG